jgi:predicted AAA+ superfamily ATPase
MAALQDVSETPARWGAWVENACLAHAWNRGQEVYYWREDPLEVDGVLVGSWGKWAIEVKTGNFAVRDLAGLFEFCRRHAGFRPLVLCARERAEEAIPGVRLMYWGDFLRGKALSE